MALYYFAMPNGPCTLNNCMVSRCRFAAVTRWSPSDGRRLRAFSIDKIMAKLTKVKLRGGVVGKISLVLIVTAIAFSGLALPIRNVWLSGVLGTMLFLLVFFLAVA